MIKKLQVREVVAGQFHWAAWNVAGLTTARTWARGRRWPSSSTIQRERNRWPTRSRGSSMQMSMVSWILFFIPTYNVTFIAFVFDSSTYIFRQRIKGFLSKVLGVVSKSKKIFCKFQFHFPFLVKIECDSVQT